MKLPEVYKELMDLAAEIEKSFIGVSFVNRAWAERLSALAAEIPRRKPVMRGPIRSRKMTDELREEIRAYHKRFPTMLQRDIARHFNVDHGRVSETLAGFRE